MRLNAQQVYDKLIHEDRILELQGQIRFFFGDVDIIVKQKDVVGNIIQEWLQGWFDKRGIEYAPSENTQMPPDFFLNPDDKTTGLLEVKAFNINDAGVVTIKDLWLKKVWQITRRMKNWAVNLQIKKGVVHKIRPGKWYSNRTENIPMFRSLEDFISAIEETVYQNPETHGRAAIWRRQFLASYEAHYGVRLDIPRWSDIEGQYR